MARSTEPAYWDTRLITGRQQSRMTVERETSQQERLGTIELYRTNHGWVDRNEAFRIRVDGTERGSVYPYQHVDFQVAEGRHEVAISLDDLGPRSIQIE